MTPGQLAVLWLVLTGAVVAFLVGEALFDVVRARRFDRHVDEAVAAVEPLAELWSPVDDWQVRRFLEGQR